jgi:hypothetical protein
MKHLKFLPLVIIVVMTLSSCSSLSRSMREPLVRFDLNANDMELSDPVTGTATSVRILGIDWERLFSNSYASTGVYVIGDIMNSAFSVVPGSKEFAIYDMIEKNPGWDFVVYPQYHTDTYHVLGLLYSRSTTTVTARMGRLK